MGRCAVMAAGSCCWGQAPDQARGVHAGSRLQGTGCQAVSRHTQSVQSPPPGNFQIKILSSTEKETDVKRCQLPRPARHNLPGYTTCRCMLPADMPMIMGRLCDAACSYKVSVTATDWMIRWVYFARTGGSALILTPRNCMGLVS